MFSAINPIGLAFVLLMGILLLFVPRQYAMLPIFAVALYIPMTYRIILADMDFYMLRVIFLFGWIRIVSRSETIVITLNRIDKIFITQVILFIITYSILWGTTGAFINRLGQAFDLVSMYFISRILLIDFNDIERIIKSLLILSIPIAFTMVVEQTYHFNIFSIFGAETLWDMMREGKVRAQATFPHSILAGGFGASLLPLIVGLWWNNRIQRVTLLIGLLSTLVIVITSNSSGPFISLIAGIIGLIFWFFHKNMRFIFWSIVASLAMLHFFIMKAPVWALIGRLGTSGSSYHREQIVDQTIEHFSEWWLIGTQSTSHWGHLSTMHDMANFYCRIAVDSGIIGLVLFMSIISLCFKIVGRTIRQTEQHQEIRKFMWAIGASLFSHTIAFMGVSYTGTNLLILYMTFSILSTISVMEFRKVRLISNSILNKEILV